MGNLSSWPATHMHGAHARTSDPGIQKHTEKGASPSAVQKLISLVKILRTHTVSFLYFGLKFVSALNNTNTFNL